MNAAEQLGEVVARMHVALRLAPEAPAEAVDALCGVDAVETSREALVLAIGRAPTKTDEAAFRLAYDATIDAEWGRRRRAELAS